MKFHKGTYLFSLILLVLCTFVFASQASAQSLDLPSIDMGMPLNIEIIPETPGPNSTVTAVVKYSGIDSDRTTFSWSINGTLKKSGVGEVSFSFKTGDVGKSVSLKVSAKTPNGQIIEKIITIIPSSVDLVYEAQSYIPPFYKGKPLFSNQGVLRIIAIPNIVVNGKAVDSKKLVYTWKSDGQILSDSSGYGKNVMIFNGGVPWKSTEITVMVQTIDQKISAENTLILNPIQPKIVVYEDNPVYGILFNKAILDGFTTSKTELSFVAEPYFFSTQNSGLNLSYSWRMNDQSLSISKKSVTITNKNNLSGMAEVGIKITNSSKIFQYAQTSSAIEFVK